MIPTPSRRVTWFAADIVPEGRRLVALASTRPRPLGLRWWDGTRITSYHARLLLGGVVEVHEESPPMRRLHGIAAVAAAWDHGALRCRP